MHDWKKEIDAKYRFRDPIYGYIFLTEQERRIIDTPLFQRLRRVHQLALTKYVYPSAEHSRFVHSLGVVQCATEMFMGVLNHALTVQPPSDASRCLKLLRYAALLHDIGHLPFSHAAEKQWLDGLSHEDISRYIILNYRPITSVLEEDEAAEVVASLLTKEYKPKYRLLHEIISGQLDADRADYLLRDSYCCGVRYGEFDFSRYIQIFGASFEDNGLKLTVAERDIYVAEAFLMARYHYNLQVPYHRTRNGYDICLRQFLRTAKGLEGFRKIEDGTLKSLDFDKYEDLDDYALFEYFKQGRRASNESSLWAHYLLRQDHLRVVIDTNTQREDSGSAQSFKRFCLALEKDQRFEKNADYFVQTDKIELTKIQKQLEEANGEGEGDVPADTSQAHTIWVQGLDGELRDICEHSWMFSRLRDKPLRVLRVYVTSAKLEEARELLAAQRG